jgi:hypothetical protein
MREVTGECRYNGQCEYRADSKPKLTMRETELISALYCVLSAATPTEKKLARKSASTLLKAIKESNDE